MIEAPTTFFSMPHTAEGDVGLSESRDQPRDVRSLAAGTIVLWTEMREIDFRLPTLGQSFHGWNEVVVADDGECGEHVDGDDEM